MTSKHIKIPWSSRLLAFLARWQWQVVITLACSAVAAWFAPQFAAPSDVTRLDDFQSHAVLLGFLASVLALTASIMAGHVLQFLDSTLSEKRDLYLQFRGTLITFDEFLRSQDESLQVVHAAQSVSWELKKIRLEDFPIMDWEKRMAALVKECNRYPKDAENPNLHLEIMGHLGYCEEMVSSVGLCCIKQIVARVLLQPIIKMFSLLAGIIAVLIYYYLCFSSVSASLRWAIPVFFTVGTILLTYEVAWYLYRHVAENTDLTE